MTHRKRRVPPEIRSIQPEDFFEAVGRVSLALAELLRGREESLGFRPGFPRMLDIRNVTKQYPR